MKHTRTLFWLITILTVFSVLIVLPKVSISKSQQLPFLSASSGKISFDPQFFLRPLIGQQNLEFRRGLDLQGGTSITFAADMSHVSPDQRDTALDSAKDVIEKRINLFGVSEPVIQTAHVNNDYRVIVELPGVTDANAAINLIGKTAQLTFWEGGASTSGSLNPEIATSSAYPLGVVQAVGSNPKQTNLTGSDLQQASVTFDSNTGKPQVSLVFTSDGSQKFADITKRNVGKIVAIVLDNQVIEAPTVNQAILTGNAVITGSFTQDQAQQLVTQLNAGALPVPLHVLQEQVIGPTLGIVSLQKTLFAGILGFLIIVIFMCVLYKKLGIVASVALFIYTMLVLTIFKLSTLTPYGVTLTLSGIAGFILSIGMAVDANILIFERTKEELRRGKTQKDAIEVGFSRAWPSIRDSNSSTLITCFILYEFGTGIVKGFALVLAIGVLVSLFSAIVVTRTFLRVMNADKSQNAKGKIQNFR